MKMIKYKHMKKLRLYVDTSALGGIFDTEEPRRVSTAERLLYLIEDGTYEGYISRLTIEEVFAAPEKIHEKLQVKMSRANFVVLEENEESISLAEAYVTDGAIPDKYRDDARHIAIGVIHDLDYIVSWNYKHMVNIGVRRRINSINIRMGYNAIEIVAPEEVTGDGEVEI
jgi:predicted nucleic acid-binding protein